MKTKYLLLTAAALGGLLTAVNPALAQNWTRTSAPTASWQAIASSADGNSLIAASSSSVYTSTNSGASWAPKIYSYYDWTTVASSADGTKLVAAFPQYGAPGSIYTSTNSGTTWTDLGSRNWHSIASSADGTRLVAAISFPGYAGGYILISTNSGASWVQTGAPYESGWSSVASSADGSKLVAGGNGYDYLGYGFIYTSTNFGATWTATYLTDSVSTNYCLSVASSADGTKMVAGGNSAIYISSDSGATWAETTAPRNTWQTVASSADGNTLLAAPGGFSSGPVYISTDSGSNWLATLASGLGWASVVCSADGNKLVAAAYSGGIYTLQATNTVIVGEPVSQTILAGTNLVLSVAALGVSPLTYQWTFNGTNVPGATNGTLELINIRVTDSGLYAVLVSGSSRSALSSNALLTVLPAFATTQPATEISGIGAMLNGLVTTGTNDTAVWFQWGTDINYGQSTAAADLGVAYSSRPFNYALTNLAPATAYHYRVVASNAFGIAAGADASFVTGPAPFILTSAPFVHWTSVASSADGSKLVALEYGTNSYNIYASSDSAGTWSTLTNAPNEVLTCVASSADGVKLVAGGNSVYVSTNSGATWTLTSAPSIGWDSVASSADGTKLMAASSGFVGQFYTSADSGTTWSNTLGYPNVGWSTLACSADGTKWVAAVAVSQALGGQIFISTNSGYTWQPSGAPDKVWGAVASSADGTKLAAAVGDRFGYGVIGPIYTSTNSGATWKPSNMPYSSCWCVVSSADGTKLVAFGGLTYSSTDSGATWTAPFLYAPGRFGSSSADGNMLVSLGVSQLDPRFRGFIFTSQTTPTPLLNLTPLGSNALLSWTIPSMDFALQQNSDFTTTNWTDVPTPPVLNLTNLQNQVMVSPTNGSAFFRLKH